MLVISALGALIGTCAPSSAQQSMYNLIQGSWVNDDSSSTGANRGFVIDNHRNVYTRNGGLQGRITESGKWGSNFIFEGQFSRGDFICAYDVTFVEGDRMARFRVVHESPLGVACPDGRFVRSIN